MAIRGKSVCVVVVRVLLTALVLAVCVLVACLGGFLNRCRGGYFNYTKHLEYWPAHVLSRQTFSLATGILVLILGAHLRAGIVVWLLTQWSLYVGWGTYMSIGDNTMDYESRAGIFDWMLGRQNDMDWNFTHRFIREYSGMSMRGLIWTAPQGYALQYLGFGWQYSLSGSLMSIIYYSGWKMHAINTPNQLGDLLDGPEFYWGMYIWLVLMVSCISQLVYRLRQRVYSHNKEDHGGTNPHDSFQVCLYKSLNRVVANVTYNILFIVFWIILCASTVFYSLVIQTDIRNKGQTFFGLFISSLALTMFMCWKWSASFTLWMTNKEQRKLKKSHSNAAFPSRINYLEQRGMPGVHPSETDRLLPTYNNWPYSHPDKGFGDPHSRTDVPSPVPFQTSPNLLSRNYHAPPLNQLSHAHKLSTKVWLFIDKWVYMDVFVMIRHVIGILSIVSLLCTIGLCCYTIVWSIHEKAPVFDPQYSVCINETIWNNTVIL